MSIELPCLCVDEVQKYLKTWDEHPDYTLQESALRKLFRETYPKNTDIDEVLVKVSTLNDFYSTHIFKIFPVAEHIIDLAIDDRLCAADPNLVTDIAQVEVSGGGTRRFYSFASKYCSHHRPEDFPIYDSYVDQLLRQFRRRDHFQKFKNDDLKDYPSYKEILLSFRDYYGLAEYTLKDIDRYLWQLGKEMNSRY